LELGGDAFEPRAEFAAHGVPPLYLGLGGGSVAEHGQRRGGKKESIHQYVSCCRVCRSR